MSGSDKSSTPAPSNGDKKKPLETKKELTEEDKKLKSNLETLVNVIKESSEKLHLNPTLNNNDPNNEIIILCRNALETLRKEIRSSTGSMTALPKPLKFLRPHFAELFNIFNNFPINSNKILLAEILSVLCMSIIFSSNEKNLSLKLKLIARRLNKTLSLKNEDIGEWGHEYVRHLAGEIGKEFQSKTEKAAEEGEKKEKSTADSSSSSSTTTTTPTTTESGGEEKKIEEKKVDKEAIKYILKDDSELLFDELIELVDEIIPFFLKHNAEFDAVDLLLETEQIDKILQTSYFTTDNSDRICKYLLKCVDYIVDPEEQTKIYNVAYQIYLKFSFFADALRVAIKMSDKEKMLLCFQSCQSDRLMQKQLGFILGSQKIVLEQLKDDEELMQCIGNVQLSSFYQHLAADLDVKEPKSVEDITKPHLEGEGSRRNIRAQPTAQSGVDSAKQNLAATFINAFVNAGFGKDLLLTPEGSEWLYKNKSHGMLSAAASLGMIMLWDVESGFSAVDRYSFSRESFIKAGSALAHGILSSGVTSEMDAAQALLAEHLESKDNDLKVSAILGLGFAYAGTEREDVLEMLVPILVQEGQSMEVVSSVCLALGLVFCGTANDGISGNIVVAFMDRSDTDLKDSTARMMCLGMGLLFLGKGDTLDGALNAIKAIEHPISKYLSVVVESCAYAGSSSVLQIQKLLNVCSEHLSQDEEEEKKEPLKMIHQEAAILGIAAVAMGEELGQEMALRAIDHILQYCEVNIRRVVPFALSLLSLSHPRIGVVDTLTKLSHDQDQQVSQNAVLSLGFVGAGTNNSRIAGQLRNLASYYNKEPNHLFLIRLAQGLLHMGKGLLTINPVSSDGFLLNKVALSGLLISLHGALDLKNTYLNKRHYLLYSLVTAIRPRMLMILDENLKPIPVPVRVGQKVDTVGAAGKPKTITGFQTHTTPVLISAGERAELANEEYIPLSNVLEGFVIVKKNPNYIDEQK